MNYNQALDYIFSFDSLNKEPSLERIKALLSFVDNPQNEFKSVHIAGTNGKGSVATYISSSLSESGYKTGLFTSPHIISFCERIKIDSRMIAKDDVAEITSLFVPFVEALKEKPTAFDLITAIAFEYFKREGCDFAVVECGLGGAFDSTNIVLPEVSVLCSISLDHIGLLGDNVRDIAKEKCGIIKPGVPVVSYPFKKTKDIFNPQPLSCQEIIKEVSQMRQSELIVAEPDEITFSDCTLDKTTIEAAGLALTSHLIGVHQKANMLTAYTALKVLSDKYEISDESIVKGLLHSYISTRLEKVSDNPKVIVDGGHNVDCARALSRFIQSQLKGEKLTAVIAMMRDKQCDEVLSETAGLFDEIITTQTNSTRALGSGELAEKARHYNKNVSSEEETHDAIKRAIDTGNTVIVFGSFYLAGEAKEFFSATD